MSSISYKRTGDYVDKLVDTGTPPNDPARVHPEAPYRWLRVVVDSGTATISVISGLDKLANDRETTLAFEGTAIVAVDDTEQQVQIADGTGTLDVSTANTVKATALDGVPARESSTVIVEAE